MGEALTKAQWQEKKHGSKRDRQAAVSAQTARVVNKLLERSQGLSNYSHESVTNAVTKRKVFSGAKDGNNEATLTNSLDNWNLGEERNTIGIAAGEYVEKPLLRKERTVKTATVFRKGKDMLDSRTYASQIHVDSEGKRKPVESQSFGTGERYSQSITADEVIRDVAPALYEVKKAIDDAENQKSRRAA